MILYHFTCDYSARGIERDGVVNPSHHPFLGADLAWFTNLEEPPTREALGLTSHTLTCDRLAHRFTAALPADGVMPWTVWARQNGLTRTDRDLLETEGTMPRYWYVSESPVLVEVAS